MGKRGLGSVVILTGIMHNMSILPQTYVQLYSASVQLEYILCKKGLGQTGLAQADQTQVCLIFKCLVRVPTEKPLDRRIYEDMSVHAPYKIQMLIRLLNQHLSNLVCW